MFVLSGILVIVGMFFIVPLEVTDLNLDDTMIMVRFWIGYGLFIIGVLVAAAGALFPRKR